MTPQTIWFLISSPEHMFRLLLIGRMRMMECRWFCQWWWLWEWRWWWCSGMKCNKRQRWLVGNAALYKKREDSATDNSEEKKLNFQWICAQVVFQRRVQFSVKGKLKGHKKIDLSTSNKGTSLKVILKTNLIQICLLLRSPQYHNVIPEIIPMPYFL